MRTRSNTIVTALVLFSLVSGTIGCQSNGGAWYKPNSYSWHNPFKKEDTIAPYADRHAAVKPSIGATPNVVAPPGGYGTKEADPYGAKLEKQVQVQYNNTPTSGGQPAANHLAMANPAYGGVAPGGVSPEQGLYSNTGSYNPGEYNPNAYHPGPYAPSGGGMPPQGYQPTSIQQQAPPSSYAPNYTPLPGQTPMDHGHPNLGTVPPTNYSPFAPASPEPVGGFAPESPVYDPVPTQGFGAPAGTPTGFGAPPPSYGSGYIAAPSTYTH